MDTETEHLIQDAIANILQNRTSFIIAHRLSTIRSADRILVIRDGKIIGGRNPQGASGTKRPLCKAVYKPVYYAAGA